MWRVVHRDCKNGTTTVVAKQLPDLSGCKQLSSHLPSDETFFLWDEPLPEDRAKSVEIFKQVKAANNGRVKLMTIGARTTPTSDACSGDCYCVVDSDGRSCQGEYCYDHGFCFWLSCNEDC